MPISDRTRKILWARSGNRCAVCRHSLVAEPTPEDPAAVVGDECHIVARSPGGPRAGGAGDPDSEDNLILLCRVDHKRVDDQPNYFTVERLRAIKRAHETWVHATLSSQPPQHLPDADAQLFSLSRGVARHFSTLPVSLGTSGAKASTDGRGRGQDPTDAPGAPALESLQALRGAAARYGAREYIADGETVPITAYPSLADVALSPAGEVRTGPISLTSGMSLDLRFKDAVVGFGIYYKQGLYPSNFNIYLHGGTQKVLVGKGYFPETGFVAEVSGDTIERVIIQPQAQGNLEITGIYIFAKGQHEGVL